MIDLDIVQRLYFKAEELCDAEGRNEAWLFERKFAELIIEECIQVGGPEDSYADCWFKAKAHSVAEIKEHFGVE